jgi:hypothetical protein
VKWEEGLEGQQERSNRTEGRKLEQLRRDESMGSDGGIDTYAFSLPQGESEGHTEQPRQSQTGRLVRNLWSA